MVTMRVDDVRFNVHHRTRDVTTVDGMTHKIVEGGEMEVTITCRVDLRDRAKIDAINDLAGSKLVVELRAPSAPASTVYHDINPMAPTEFDLDLTNLIRGNRRFTEPPGDVPAPSPTTGSW